jgi:hypothetical protein
MEARAEAASIDATAVIQLQEAEEVQASDEELKDAGLEESIEAKADLLVDMVEEDKAADQMLRLVNQNTENDNEESTEAKAGLLVDMVEENKAADQMLRLVNQNTENGNEDAAETMTLDSMKGAGREEGGKRPTEPTREAVESEGEAEKWRRFAEEFHFHLKGAGEFAIKEQANSQQLSAQRTAPPPKTTPALRKAPSVHKRKCARGYLCFKLVALVKGECWSIFDSQTKYSLGKRITCPKGGRGFFACHTEEQALSKKFPETSELLFAPRVVLKCTASGRVVKQGLSIVVAAQLTPLEIVGQRVHAAESFEQVRNLLSSGYIRSCTCYKTVSYFDNDFVSVNDGLTIFELGRKVVCRTESCAGAFAASYSVEHAMGKPFPKSAKLLFAPRVVLKCTASGRVVRRGGVGVLATQLTPLAIVGQTVFYPESFPQVRSLLKAGRWYYKTLYRQMLRLDVAKIGMLRLDTDECSSLAQCMGELAVQCVGQQANAEELLDSCTGSANRISVGELALIRRAPSEGARQFYQYSERREAVSVWIFAQLLAKVGCAGGGRSSGEGLLLFGVDREGNREAIPAEQWHSVRQILPHPSVTVRLLLPEVAAPVVRQCADGGRLAHRRTREEALAALGMGKFAPLPAATRPTDVRW